MTPVEAARRLAPRAAEVAPRPRRPGSCPSRWWPARGGRAVPPVRPARRRRARGAPGRAGRGGPGARGGDGAAAGASRSADQRPADRLLPRGDRARDFADPETMVAGVFAPRGRAPPEDGGFRVSGRWPFASGCRHAHWLMGGCVVEEARRSDGCPSPVLAPAEAFTIHDTWHVMGLRGHGQPRHRARRRARPGRAHGVRDRGPPVGGRPAVRVPAVRPARASRSRPCASASPAARSATSSRWPARRSRPAGAGRSPSGRPCRRRSRAPRPPAAPPERCSTRRSARRGTPRSPARRARAPSRRPPARRLARRHDGRGRDEAAYRLAGGGALYGQPAAAAAARRPGRRAAHARRARDVGADRPPAARAADGRHAALIAPISCAAVIEDDLDWPEDRKLIALLGEDGAEQFRSWLDNFPDSVGILWAIRDDAGRIVDFSFGYGNPAILRAFSLPASSRGQVHAAAGAAPAGRPQVLRRLRPRLRHGRAVGARGHVRHAVRGRLHARHVHRALRAARRRADQLPHGRHRAAADGARAAQLRRRRRARPERADRRHRDARRAAGAAPGAAAARRRAAPAADEHGPGAGDDRGRARVRKGGRADHGAGRARGADGGRRAGPARAATRSPSSIPPSNPSRSSRLPTRRRSTRTRRSGASRARCSARRSCSRSRTSCCAR